MGPIFKLLNKKLVGFNKTQIKQAEKINKGDYLIAYLTKVSRFVAILEVTKEVIVSNDQIWTEGTFPVRIGAKVIKQLPIPYAIPMSLFLGKFSFLMTNKMPVSGVWSAHVRSSPRRWKLQDGEAVSLFIDNVKKSGRNPNLNSDINNKKKQENVLILKNLIEWEVL